MGKVKSNHEFCLLLYPIPFGANLSSSDWPVWYFDSKGLFSVKSAYKLAAQNRDNEAGWEAGTLVEGVQWLLLSHGTKYGS